MEELINTLGVLHGWEHVKTEPEGFHPAPRPKERVPVVRGIRPVLLQPLYLGPVLHFRIRLSDLIDVRRQRILAKLNAKLRKNRNDRAVDQLAKDAEFHGMRKLADLIFRDRDALRRFRSGVLGDLKANALDLYDQRLNQENGPDKSPRLSVSSFQIGKEEGVPMAYLSVGLSRAFGEEMPRRKDRE